MKISDSYFLSESGYPGF